METATIVIPVAWTLIMTLCLWYVKSNKKFPVTRFETNVRVDVCPALAWSKTKNITVVLGYVFLGIMWVTFILLGTDVIGFPERSNGATYTVAAPTVLSAILFFAGYSSRLVNNYVSIPAIEFDRWLRDGLIERRDGNNYVDVNGNELWNSFANKEFIR